MPSPLLTSPNSPPKSGLLDTTVWASAIEFCRVEEKLHIVWWGKEWVMISRQFNFHLRKPKPGQEEDFLHIPNLAKLIKSGQFSARLSDAVNLEREAVYSNFSFDFFGIDISTIPVIDTGIRNRAIRFTLNDMRRPTPRDTRKAATQETNPRYRELLTILGKSHALDIFHIWTAEMADLDAFVSLDKKFRRHFESMRGKHGSKIEMVSPKDLALSFGLEPGTEAELYSIRDISRQQRLVPMCQFRYPKKWSERLWLLLTNNFELKPAHGRLEIPSRADFTKVLFALDSFKGGFGNVDITNGPP